jgi:hypothetical protein
MYSRVAVYVLSAVQLALCIVSLSYYVYMYNVSYQPVMSIQTNTEYTQMVVSSILVSLAAVVLLFCALHMDACIRLGYNQAALGGLTIATDPSSNASLKQCCFGFQSMFQYMATPSICMLQLACMGLNLFLVNRLEYWIWIVEVILFPCQTLFLCMFLYYHWHDDASESISQGTNEQPFGCFWMHKRWFRNRVGSASYSFRYAWFVRYQWYWSEVAYLILFLFFLTLVASVSQSFGTDGGFYTDTQLNAMNANVESAGLFQSMNTTRTRIVLVLFDGLGRDEVDTQPDWVTLRQTLGVQLGVATMYSQVPTVSFPNWIALVSGMRPEISGTLGNIQAISFLFAPPLLAFDDLWTSVNRLNVFDTITQTYTNFSVKTSFVGSEWFYSLINGDAQPFTYTIAPPNPYARYESELEIEVNEDTAHLQNALQALDSSTDFLFVYFNQPDPCGHLYGLGSSYSQCAGRMAVSFGIIIGAIDASSRPTLLFGFADHGHVKAGGHGGTHSGVERTPLMVYQKNADFSNLATANIDSAQFGTTIAALLQITAPRQAQGTWIDELVSVIQTQTTPILIGPNSYIPEWLLAKFDLFQQKRQLTQSFYRQCGTSVYELRSIEQNNPVMVMSRGSTNPYGIPLDVQYFAELNADPNNPVLQAEIGARLDANIVQLDRLYNDKRTSTWNAFLIRNYLANAFLVSLLVLWLAHRMDTMSLLQCPKTRRDGYQAIDSEAELDATQMQTQFQIYHICFYLVYLVVSWVVFIAVGAAYGYTVMDSSFLHHPSVIGRYLLTTLLPGTIVLFLFERILLWKYVSSHNLRLALGRPDRPDRCMRAFGGCSGFEHYFFQFWRWIFIDLSIVTNYVTDWGPIYLCRTWLMMLSCFTCLLIFLLEGVFTCVIPWVFPLTFIDDAAWVFRFFVISFMFMSAPLVFGSLVLWCCMPCTARDDDTTHCNITKAVTLYDAKYKPAHTGSSHETHTQN